MVGTNKDARHAQRMSALLAICIIVGILIVLPIGGGFADWMNATNAPTDSVNNRYEEITQQTGVTYDIDSTQFKSTAGYRSYWIWENNSGYLNYNNVTQSAGVISTARISTAGNDLYPANVSNSTNNTWAMTPYYKIYLDYTAYQAYADNVVRIVFNMTGFTGFKTGVARSITLEAGGVTFFTLSRAATDGETLVAESVEIDTNDLRRAIIESGDTSFFVLTIKNVGYSGANIVNSHVQAYHVEKLAQRDDGILIVGALAVGICIAGIFLVQPKYNLPIGLSGGSNKPGRF